MNTPSSPVIERVKKLLALSNSDVPAERDAALAKANALIAEHNIDMVLVQGDSVKPEAFVEERIQLGRRIPVEYRFIAWLLQAHFRCTILWFSGSKGRIFKVIGRKSDAEFGRWLVGYLVEEFRRRWSYFSKANGVPLREKNTFLYGCYQGLNQRLREERQATESTRISQIAAQQLEATPLTYDTGNGAEQQAVGKLQDKYALAVQSEEAARSAEVARMYPRLGRARTVAVRTRSHSSLDAGRRHGATINLNRPLAAAA